MRRKLSMLAVTAIWLGSVVAQDMQDTNNGIECQSDFLPESLPVGWVVDIASDRGRPVFVITTTEMETIGSRFGGDSNEKLSSELAIRIRVHPRYSDTMIERLKDHNRTVSEMIDNLDNVQEIDELNRQLIEMPMFLNCRYGFSVDYLSRVPANDADAELVIDVMKDVMNGWEYVGSASWADEDASAIDILRTLVTW